MATGEVRKQMSLLFPLLITFGKFGETYLFQSNEGCLAGRAVFDLTMFAVLFHAGIGMDGNLYPV